MYRYMLLLPLQRCQFSLHGRLQGPIWVVPSCDEEKEAPAVDQKRASATAAPPVHVRVRRDRDTDPSGGDERVELYGQEGRGRGG